MLLVTAAVANCRYRRLLRDEKPLATLRLRCPLGCYACRAPALH